MSTLRDFKKCPVCHDWHWSDMACDPVYHVYHEEYLGEDHKKVHACSFEDAAEKYGMYYNEDSAEYPLVNGEDFIIVTVEEFKTGERRRVKVSAEPSIDYYTEEIK